MCIRDSADVQCAKKHDYHEKELHKCAHQNADRRQKEAHNKAAKHNSPNITLKEFHRLIMTYMFSHSYFNLIADTAEI